MTLVKLHVKHVEPLSFNLKQCGQMLASNAPTKMFWNAAAKKGAFFQDARRTSLLDYLIPALTQSDLLRTQQLNVGIAGKTSFADFII